MRILAEQGTDDLARVYVAETESGKLIEFAQSIQPPHPIEKKWVLTISSLSGCPVGCNFCDAGGWYDGKLSTDEIIGQIDYLVKSRFPSMEVPVEKFKVQFARVGEPSLNDAVLDTLERLSGRYTQNGQYASVSTIAPKGRDKFFKRLVDIKNRLYRDGRFQLQFSIHTTDPELRDRILPVKKWGFDEIARYGDFFYNPDVDRKITLNFALEKSYPFDIETLRTHFDPGKFLIKITPLNPTVSVAENKLVSYIDTASESEICKRVNDLRNCGFEVIVSIGDRKENEIGSNCGQYLQKILHSGRALTV